MYGCWTEFTIQTTLLCVNKRKPWKWISFFARMAFLAPCCPLLDMADIWPAHKFLETVWTMLGFFPYFHYYRAVSLTKLMKEYFEPLTFNNPQSSRHGFAAFWLMVNLCWNWTHFPSKHALLQTCNRLILRRRGCTQVLEGNGFSKNSVEHADDPFLFLVSKPWIGISTLSTKLYGHGNAMKHPA